jgi:hypothetical protein
MNLPGPPQPSLKEQLVGTWTLAAWEQKKADGSRLLQFGENPVGMACFDAGGRYIIAVMRSDRPSHASGVPWQGTADENKITADGTMTYFGTYVVDEKGGSIAVQIQGSSFPNWNGSTQKRLVSIAADELTLSVHPPSGEIVDVIWRRAK